MGGRHVGGAAADGKARAERLAELLGAFVDLDDTQAQELADTIAASGSLRNAVREARTSGVEGEHLRQLDVQETLIRLTGHTEELATILTVARQGAAGTPPSREAVDELAEQLSDELDLMSEQAGETLLQSDRLDTLEHALAGLTRRLVRAASGLPEEAAALAAIGLLELLDGLPVLSSDQDDHSYDLPEGMPEGMPESRAPRGGA